MSAYITDRSRWQGVFLLLVAFASQGAVGAEQDAETRAEHILRTAGLKGGVITHLGCGNGKLTAELGRSKRFIVHGLSDDEKEVDTARAHIRSQKLYGRVSVERGSYERPPGTVKERTAPAARRAREASRAYN